MPFCTSWEFRLDFFSFYGCCSVTIFSDLADSTTRYHRLLYGEHRVPLKPPIFVNAIPLVWKALPGLLDALAGPLEFDRGLER